MQVLEQDPVPPRQLNRQVDRDLEMIAVRCLQKPADLRYDSAEALAEDLEAYLKHEPIAARSGRISPGRLALVPRNASCDGTGELGPALDVAQPGAVRRLPADQHPLVAGRDQPLDLLQSLVRRIRHLGRRLLDPAPPAWGRSRSWNVRSPTCGLPRCCRSWRCSPWKPTSACRRLKLSPVLGLIAGMVFLVKAGILSGPFYVQAVALFLTAGLMVLFTDYEHLIFGVVSAACFFFPGLKYYRQQSGKTRP